MVSTNSVRLLSIVVLICQANAAAQWQFATAGVSCEHYCESKSMECTEGEWPMRESDFNKILKKLPVGFRCSEVISGGLFASPVEIRKQNGGNICSWVAPERTWSKGEAAISDKRCLRVPPITASRLCPCQVKSSQLGGMTSWGGCGSDCWISHAMLSRFTAGITKIKGVTSTLLSDTYYIERNSSETLWFEVAASENSKLYRLKNNNGPWKNQIKKVKLVASTDLVNIAVVDDGDSEVLILWETGSPIDLPYFQKNSKFFRGAVPGGVYLFGPGVLRYSQDPNFAINLPEDVPLQEMVKNFSIHSIATTATSIAILLSDGRVVSWGGSINSGIFAYNAVEIVSNRGAFAALLSNGRVSTWGDRGIGGLNIRNLELTNVISITATIGAFAALSEDGKVTVWGEERYGGDFGKPYRIVRQDAECPVYWDKVENLSGCESIASHRGTNITMITDPSLPQKCFKNNTLGDIYWNNDATIGRSRCLWIDPFNWSVFSQEDYVPSITEPVDGVTEKECTAYCCELSECIIVSFDSNYGCQLLNEYHDILNKTDDYQPKNETRNSKTVRYYKTTSQFCTNPTSSYSLTRKGVRGLFATSKSFLATGSAGTTIWPRYFSNKIKQDSEYPTSTIVGTRNSFIIAVETGKIGKGRIDTIFSEGGDTNYYASAKPYIDPPPSIETTNPIVAIRTTDVAATVVFENKSSISWEATPDPLNAFWMIDMVGCHWIGNTEGIAYYLFDWHHTREECAMKCLQLKGCTGFEYIKTGQYCAPWMNHECSNQTSREFLYNQKPNGYELYISKEIAKTELPKDTKRVLRSKEFNFIGDGRCLPSSNNSLLSAIYLGDVIDSQVFLQDSYNDCSEECITHKECTAFEIRDMNNTLSCKLFSEVDTISVNRTDDLFTACFTIVLEDPTVEELSVNIHNDLNDTEALVFCDKLQFRRKNNPSLYRIMTVPCREIATVPGGATDVNAPEGPISSVRIPAGTFPNALYSTMSVVTSQTGNPKYDPAFWYYSLAKPGGDVVDVVLDISHDEYFVNHFVPTQRGVPSPWYDASLPSEWSSYDLVITFYPRRDPVYHVLSNRACQSPKLSSITYPEHSVPLPFHNVTIEDCTRFCKFTRSPLYCLSFEFTVSTGECVLLFNMCTDKNMFDKPGTNLYVLSKLRAVRESRNPSQFDNKITTPLSADRVVSSKNGFSVMANNGQREIVKSWGDQLYGGGVSENNLGLGQLVYLTSNDTPDSLDINVVDVIGGVTSFAALSVGSLDFDECIRSPCDNIDDTNYQISNAPTADAVQFCVDNKTSSSSFDDFTCYCKRRASYTQSKPDPCESFSPIDHWPIILILLPGVGFYFVIYATCTWAKRESDRRIEGLSEMYFIHASPEERGTLRKMLLANKGNEVKLLQALIPDYMERAREVRMFLLWQLRKESSTRKTGVHDVELLPYDLIRLVQDFTYGAISLRKYSDRLMTPFGYLCSTLITKISVPKKPAKEEEEGYQTNKLWSPDFFTPLVEDGANRPSG